MSVSSLSLSFWNLRLPRPPLPPASRKMALYSSFVLIYLHHRIFHPWYCPAYRARKNRKNEKNCASSSEGRSLLVITREPATRKNGFRLSLYAQIIFISAFLHRYIEKKHFNKYTICTTISQNYDEKMKQYHGWNTLWFFLF